MLAIVNSSTKVTDAEGNFIVKALNTLLPNFCRDWNVAPTLTTYIPKGKTTTIPRKIYLFDDATIEGILGYHNHISGNVSYGKCFVNTILSEGGVILYSPNPMVPTVAEVVCHEVFELLVNPYCNEWWDIGDSHTLYAKEPCDPVQSNALTVTIPVSSEVFKYNIFLRKTLITPAVYQKVGCSDWILPAWGNPHDTKGPFNHLKTLEAPFTLDKGGYGIQMTVGSAGNVFAMKFGSAVTPEQKAKYLAKSKISKEAT
jgi:hypothetical protein